MYGSGSTAVASPRKPPALVADIRRQHYINFKNTIMNIELKGGRIGFGQIWWL